MLAREKRTGEIGCEDLVPAFGGEFVCQATAVDARTCDQSPDGADPVRRAGYGTGDRRLVAHVTLYSHCFRCSASVRLISCLLGLAGADVERRDVGPARGDG